MGDCTLNGEWDIRKHSCDCAACAEKLAAWRAEMAACWEAAQAARDGRQPAALRRRAFRMKRVHEDGRCALCGRRLTMEDATVDHIQPRSRGGADDPSNWQIACYECNQAKGNRWEDPTLCAE